MMDWFFHTRAAGQTPQLAEFESESSLLTSTVINESPPNSRGFYRDLVLSVGLWNAALVL